MDNKYAVEIVNRYVSFLVNEQKLDLSQVFSIVPKFRWNSFLGCQK